MSAKRFLILCTLFLLAVFVAAPVNAQGETIKIYTSWPLTGGTQFVGESMLHATELALEHYLADHDGAGPAGFTIEIVAQDDASPTTGAWDGTIEAENAQRCVSDPQCMVYYGTYNSGAAKVSMTITNAAGILQVSPANTYAGLTRACGVENGCLEDEPGIYRPTGTVNYFRLPPTDDLQGPSGASWAYCAGFQNVYILDDTQAYGKGIADTFEAQAEAIGLTVVGHGSVEATDIDFRALLNDVRAAGADLVYGGFVMDSGGPQVIQQMDALGLFEAGMAFMGPDGLATPSLVDAVGDAAILEGNVLITFPGALPNTLASESGKRFYEEYVEQWDEPDPYATYAYTAMQVILDAIERAGEADRTAILEAFRATEDFEGPYGAFGFDENGDATLFAMFGYEWVDGAMANPVAISPTSHEECTPPA
jgi:branched-chain amino acid transport system substrate-binding protein